MIDPRYLRENLDELKLSLTKRHKLEDVDLDAAKKIDEERRALIVKTDELREKRNKVSKEIGARKSKGQDVSDIMQEVQGIGDSIKQHSDQVEALDQQFQDLLLSIPNVLDASVHDGVNDADNKEVRQ